jgi:hypothetical protein
MYALHCLQQQKKSEIYSHHLRLVYILNAHLPQIMQPDAISQLKALLSAAPNLRSQLSNTERLQLSGLAEALRNELERPDEAVFRVTFNDVS